MALYWLLLKREKVFRHLGHCSLSVRSCASWKWSTASLWKEERKPQTEQE